MKKLFIVNEIIFRLDRYKKKKPPLAVVFLTPYFFLGVGFGVLVIKPGMIVLITRTFASLFSFLLILTILILQKVF